MVRKHSSFQQLKQLFKYCLLPILAGLFVYLYLNRHQIPDINSLLSAINHALFPKVSVDQQVYEGLPKIIDGDSLRIGEHRIRLHAIDAPELAQTCWNSHRQRYRCGQYVTNALKKLIQHQTIRCEEQNRDQYDRIVAICYLGEIEINRWMVRNGYAVAYRSISDLYTLEEELAKNEKLGLWSGSFQMPWEWRRQNPRN